MIKNKFFTFVLCVTLSILLSQFAAPSIALGYIDSHGVDQVGPPAPGQDIAPGLVNCGRTGSAQDQAEGCNFAAAVDMINRLINYLIMIAVPIAAVAFAYAGWLRISAGDNPGKIKDSNNVFKFVTIGFIVILSGWLLFKFIETTFLNTGAYGTYLN